MIFWITLALCALGIVLGVVAFKLAEKTAYYGRECMWDNVSITSFTIAVISGVVAVIMLLVIAVSHTGVDATIAQDKAKYESIKYQYDNNLYENDNDVGKKELMDDIRKWNETLVYYKEIEDDFWVGIFYPNISDNFELIELVEPTDTEEITEVTEPTELIEPATTAEVTESSEPIEPTETTVEVDITRDLDPEEVEMLACIIYQEMGGDAACDMCRRRVADVVLNRVEDPRFPNTMFEVLTQPGQYGQSASKGIRWTWRASLPEEAHAVERAYQTAREVLTGQHSELYGEGYIWQAGFPQGYDQVFCCGAYYGK